MDALPEVFPALHTLQVSDGRNCHEPTHITDAGLEDFVRQMGGRLQGLSVPW